jgi:hypothetical protein
MDMSISVGLGTGSKAEMLAHLQTLLSIQARAVELQGGATGPLVTLPNIYATLAKLVENAGLKSPEACFTDPAFASRAPMQPGQPPAPPPDPMLLALQQKAAHDAAKLALERRKVEADIAFDLARLEADIALKREAMAAKAGTSCAACAAKKETAA